MNSIRPRCRLNKTNSTASTFPLSVILCEAFSSVDDELLFTTTKRASARQDCVLAGSALRWLGGQKANATCNHAIANKPERADIRDQLRLCNHLMKVKGRSVRQIVILFICLLRVGSSNGNPSCHPVGNSKIFSFESMLKWNDPVQAGLESSDDCPLNKSR